MIEAEPGCRCAACTAAAAAIVEVSGIMTMPEAFDLYEIFKARHIAAEAEFKAPDIGGVEVVESPISAQEIRMWALQQAVSLADSADAASTVERARAFADFVLGVEPKQVLQ